MVDVVLHETSNISSISFWAISISALRNQKKLHSLYKYVSLFFKSISKIQVLIKKRQK